MINEATLPAQVLDPNLQLVQWPSENLWEYNV